MFKKIFLFILFCTSVASAQQQSGTPSQIRVKTDANGYLLTAAAAQTAPISQPQVFTNTRLQTDANGYLLVVMTGGPFSGQLLASTSTDCTAPPYSFLGRTTTGLSSQAANEWDLCGGGTLGLSGNTTSVFSALPVSDIQNNITTTTTDGYILTNNTASTSGVTVQWAPRLRFHGSAWNGSSSDGMDGILEFQPRNGQNALVYRQQINNGGYNTLLTIDRANGVTISGSLSGASTVNVAATGFYAWVGRNNLLAPADGQYNFDNAAQNSGTGIDVSTDAIMKIRTRAQTGYATLDALGINASGVAGASCTLTTVAHLTVVNGIVTLCN